MDHSSFIIWEWSWSLTALILRLVATSNSRGNIVIYCYWDWELQSSKWGCNTHSIISSAGWLNSRSLESRKEGPMPVQVTVLWLFVMLKPHWLKQPSREVRPAQILEHERICPPEKSKALYLQRPQIQKEGKRPLPRDSTGDPNPFLPTLIWSWCFTAAVVSLTKTQQHHILLHDFSLFIY